MCSDVHPLADQWHRASSELWGMASCRTGQDQQVAFQGNPSGLACGLPVETLAVASVACSALAAHELAKARSESSILGGAPKDSGPITVDSGQVGLSFRSDRVGTLDGLPYSLFAPWSGFFETRDGFVRTHANYPHHRAALSRALGIAADASVAELAAHLAQRHSAEVESLAWQYGALAVEVRTRLGWMQHPQGRSRADHPIVKVDQRGAVSLPSSDRSARLALARRGLPAAGFRVLDLTRVISGPVASRTLALAGADVLRVDSPHLAEIGLQYLDTAGGKRSTLLDFDDPADLETLHDLVATADVVLTGYRPGSITRFGLSEAEIRASNPHVVLARINAWGPLQDDGFSRGFDSLVQAASGIADDLGDYESGRLARPGTLPAQALDHSVGYLVAAGIMSGLADVVQGNPAVTINGSLLGAANWLLTQRDVYPLHIRAESSDVDSDENRFCDLTLPENEAPGVPGGAVLRVPNPCVVGSGLPTQWPVPHAYGASDAAWL